ncbi:MAG: hypothetical protein ABI262_05340 [Microcoleus sp.]
MEEGRRKKEEEGLSYRRERRKKQAVKFALPTLRGSACRTV